MARGSIRLKKASVFLCLALLLWGARSIAQAQDTTHVQASAHLKSETARNVRYNTKIGVAIFVSLRDEIYPLPLLTLEPQWVIRDRIGLGLRYATIGIFNHLALQSDVFFPLKDGSRLSVGGSVGIGGVIFLSGGFTTVGLRGTIEGESRFSFGFGYDYLSEEDDYFIYIQFLWHIGRKR